MRVDGERDRAEEEQRQRGTQRREKYRADGGAAAALEFAYVREKEGAEQPLLREAQHHNRLAVAG